jgi:RHS repeat-associated protein
MVSCTYNGDTTTYTYGYDGLRRSSTKDSVTTNYVYDGTNLVAEMRPNASGTLVVVTDYLLGAQGIEAKIDETSQTEAYYQLDPTTGARLFDSNNNLIIAYRGVTSWYIYDGHGNVVGTVNGVTGAFTANPTLDVYGIPRATGAAATKQGYCGSLGHVTDDTGLVYMRARYYDPGCGRFASEDPSGNGANWYVYAGDNPVTNVDKDGKSASTLILDTINNILEDAGIEPLSSDMYKYLATKSVSAIIEYVNNTVIPNLQNRGNGELMTAEYTYSESLKCQMYGDELGDSMAADWDAETGFSCLQSALCSFAVEQLEGQMALAEIFTDD